MAMVKDPEFTEAIDTVETDQQLQIPNELPVLPLRDIVIYPFMIVPLFVSREKSIRAVDEALGENRMILLASQKDLDKEEPAADQPQRLSRLGGRQHRADDPDRGRGIALSRPAADARPRPGFDGTSAADAVHQQPDLRHRYRQRPAGHRHRKPHRRVERSELW